MTNKVTIRASMLDDISDCELRSAVSQWAELFEAQGYKLNPRKKGLGAVVGTGTHSGVQHLLRTKLESGTSGSLADAQEVGILSARADVAKVEAFDVLPDTITRDLNDAEKQVQQLTQVYYSFQAPLDNPAIVESDEIVENDLGGWFSASLSKLNLSKFELSGHLDIYTKEDRLTDLKTGARTPSPHPGQVGAYLALMRTRGFKPLSASSVFLKRVKVGKDAERPITVNYPMAEAQDLMISRVIRVAERYEQFVVTGRTDTFNQNAKSMLCSEKYCQAFGTNTCSAWKFKQGSDAE